MTTLTTTYLPRIAWLVIFVAAAIGGCESRSAAWDKARAEDSAAAYEQFIVRYEDGEFVDEAQTRLQELLAANAWPSVVDENSVEAYRSFLDEFGETSLAPKASEKLDAVFTDAWKETFAANSDSAYREFLTLAPPEVFADEANWWLGVLARVNGASLMQSIDAQLVGFSPPAQSDSMTVEFPGPAELGRSKLPEDAVLQISMLASQIPHWPSQLEPGNRVRMYYGTGRYTGALELTGATTKGLLYEPQFNMMTAFFSTRAAPSGFSMSSEPDPVAENPEWILEKSMDFRSDFVPIAIRAIRD